MYKTINIIIKIHKLIIIKLNKEIKSYLFLKTLSDVIQNMIHKYVFSIEEFICIDFI